MKAIQLHTDMPRNITMIPNEFLDHYMSGANGEFLKIYLYLLRWAGCADTAITTSSIADFFNMTESDVKRALRFWEQEKLLGIGWDDDGNISALCLRPVTAPYASRQNTAAAYPVAEPTVNETNIQTQKPVSEKVPEEHVQKVELPSYSMEDLQAFTENEHGNELFFIIQQYTGKPLSQKDMNTILFFYKGLHMSLDLIEYLFEYCISNNHSKMPYIQAVAENWTGSGIKTVDEAKAYCASINTLNTAIMNAFGIKNRYLSKDELIFIRRWHQEYQFSEELIIEACRRTILNTNAASFKYANSILERWRDNQVETIADVERLDEAFSKARSARAKQTQEKQTQTSNSRKPASRFHNFNQRTYDYQNIEQAFMKKLHSGKNN